MSLPADILRHVQRTQTFYRQIAADFVGKTERSFGIIRHECSRRFETEPVGDLKLKQLAMSNPRLKWVVDPAVSVGSDLACAMTVPSPDPIHRPHPHPIDLRRS